MINKPYCMSHYLAFRFIKDERINFYEDLKHSIYKRHPDNEIETVSTIEDIDRIIQKKIKEKFIPNKTALLLSGGIDSAILASYLPKGTKAYTFKCVAEGAIDETEQAKKYCDIYGLDHEIIEMHWSDFEDLTPELLKANGVPFHSIEVQLLKAAKIVKRNNIEQFIIGESADLVFGGMDKLISKDWLLEDFKKRYNFVEPARALKEYVSVDDVYEKYRLPNNKIDFLTFMDEIFSIESSTSYMHAFQLGNIKYFDPYSYMKIAEPLNLNRVRNGEPKYMVRELFTLKYPKLEIPKKIPMPRATNQWLKDYKVSRPEFIPNCTENMTGDQKWLCWCLEKFLDMYEKGEL